MNMERDVLALFDFCDTLVDFQTANSFVDFVIKQKGLRRNMVDYLRIILNRLSLMPILNRCHKKMSVNKSLLLYRLKGITFTELDLLAKDFYEQRIKPHIVENVLSELLQAQMNGFVIALVSGGYDIYLKYFTAEYNIPIVLCTELSITDNIFTGGICNTDCMGQEKVRRLLDYFQVDNLTDIFSGVIGYSDSNSDLPLFSLCTDKVAVLSSDEIPKWVHAIGARVIWRK